MFPLSVYEIREFNSAMGARRLCYLPQLKPLDEQKPSGMHTNFPTSGSNWTVGKGVCCILPEKNLIPVIDHRTQGPVSCVPLARLFPQLRFTHQRFISADWQLWTAATVTDETLRSNMIGLVMKYAGSEGLNNNPFPDEYNSGNGQMNTVYDRTVVGGHFALVCRSLLSPT